jgi:iron(III) transport system permease protein
VTPRDRAQPDFVHRVEALVRAVAERIPIGRIALWGLIGLLLLPVATIMVLAATAPGDGLVHLARTILPRVAATTLFVLTGTGVLTLVIGTLTAWAVTMHIFPGRAIVDRALMLPLAIPTYIAAYVWVELLAPTGALHGFLAALFGWRSARDSFLPDLRSPFGAVLILSSVLYPYVYLAARASLLQQSAAVIEVARTLGASPVAAMWRVALPLSRPALAAGAALAMMEVLGDFGAMQYLGVETLTVAIYATWLQRSSLGGAAQLALLALFVVLALVFIERAGRQRQSFHAMTTRHRALPQTEIEGARAVLMLAVCCVPVFLGFVVPVFLLSTHALRHLDAAFTFSFWRAVGHSISLASVAAMLTVGIGLVLAYARRFRASRLLDNAQTAVGVGYALPGTVLALGLLFPLAAFDNAVDALLRRYLGFSSGLVFSGGMLILVLAYVIRTLAAALGALDAGWARLSPNLEAAARTLGFDALRTVRRVHLPLLRPAIGAAAIVVFVDCLKELPATLILRPFNFNTLATEVYAAAALEQFEAAGLGALAIVATGLIPVLIMHRTLMKPNS